MPLTSVVDYCNVRLPALHPGAQLRHGASYRLHRGLLSAQVAGFVLRPALVAVHAANGALFGQRARLLVQTDHGHLVPAESLYVQAWDAEDLVFLDRFVRTFHALNHLHQGHAGPQPLVLDVHLRHRAALSVHQGFVFEALLNLLGLGPHQMVLRLDARALHADAHLQGAARVFAQRGYRLLAARPDLHHTDWDLLRRLGVCWVAPRPHDLVAWQGGATLGHAGHRSAAGRIGLWIDGVDTPETLAQAHALGADLIEGGRTRYYAPQPAAIAISASRPL